MEVLLVLERPKTGTTNSSKSNYTNHTYSKVDIVRVLLDTYLEAVEPLHRGGEGSRGKPSSVHLQMPQMWHEGSYQQIEDALRLLRELHPDLYWHVSEKYLRCTTKISLKLVSRKTPKGKTLNEYRRMVVTTTHPDIKESLVDQGVRFLAGVTPDPLWIPRAVYDRLGW